LSRRALEAADHAHGQGTNSQLRTRDSVYGTHRVGWYNTRRLHSAIGDVPPAELEADYSAATDTLQPTGTT
jgi:transposase InsO family protein